MASLAAGMTSHAVKQNRITPAQSLPTTAQEAKNGLDAMQGRVVSYARETKTDVGEMAARVCELGVKDPNSSILKAAQRFQEDPETTKRLMTQEGRLADLKHIHDTHASHLDRGERISLKAMTFVARTGQATPASTSSYLERMAMVLEATDRPEAAAIIMTQACAHDAAARQKERVLQADASKKDISR